MSSATNTRIALELETGADPIRGSVHHADGSRVCFWGWLELIEELRRVAAGEPDRYSQSSRPNAEAAPEHDSRVKRQPHTGEDHSHA